MAKAHGLNIYGYLKFLLEHRPDKDMTDEQLADLAPWSEKLQSIKNRMWIIVNYSNSQRAGVILYLTALLFGTYFDSFVNWYWKCGADSVPKPWKKVPRFFFQIVEKWCKWMYGWTKGCSKSCMSFRNVWFYAYVESLCKKSYRILYRIWIQQGWYVLFEFTSG